MKHQLLETWAINGRVLVTLLDAVDDSVLWEKPAKGKPVGGQFAHIHNVRLMWLKVAAPELHEGLSKLEDSADKGTLMSGLGASQERMAELLDRGFETGKVKGFKPHAAAFFGYLLAHEAHHRGQAELILRLLGKPLSDKVSYGIWEWGTV